MTEDRSTCCPRIDSPIPLFWKAVKNCSSALNSAIIGCIATQQRIQTQTIGRKSSNYIPSISLTVFPAYAPVGSAKVTETPFSTAEHVVALPQSMALPVD